MNFIIIDESVTFVNELKKYINNYFQNVNTDILNIIPDEINDYDAYFVDVLINDKSIFPLIKKIRKFNKYVPIIFITSYSTYCSECCLYNAFWTIYKPNLNIYLPMVLNKLKNKLFNSYLFININYSNNHGNINIDDIIYINKDGNYIIINTNNDKHYKLYTSMKNFKNKYLNNPIIKNHFIGANYGTIVNKKYILNYLDDNIILVNNKCLPVSRSHKKKINQFMKKEYINYFQ